MIDKKMNVLVIGSGGREHTLVWKIKQSPLVNKIYSIPGNGGISQDAEVYNVSLDSKEIKDFVKQRNIDFVIVGPEAPLVDGIVDNLEREDIKIFGPKKRGAMLEGSKVFAKEFMKKNKISTAPFEVFEDYDKAKEYIRGKENIVIKAEGLCGGKGVFVCDGYLQGRESLERIMKQSKFGDAGSRVVIEKRLFGEEASILVLLSKNNYEFMIPSQDHKPVFDGDRGSNTGGMGAYAPATIVDNEVREKVKGKIVEPLIEGLNKENIDYNGVLYLGLMIREGNPYVLEFNVRFGDPEIQAVLPLLKNDILEVLLDVKQDKKLDLKWEEGSCVDVVLASGGYPEKYEKGKKIFMDEEILKQVSIFHAGTEYTDKSFYTAGGRVLNVAAKADDIVKAREKAYNAIKGIRFDGMHYRKDIGSKEIKRRKSYE